MLFLTTTAPDVDEELLNRCLVLSVNEDRTQTQAIHRLQREQQTLEGLLARAERDRIVRLHRNAQRLLKPVTVVNPWARDLTFPDTMTRSRRDQMKYLTLIRAITLIHQYQRPMRQVTHAGNTIAYIEATVDDIAVANRLAEEILGRSLDELQPQTRRLLELMDEAVHRECGKLEIERTDFRFSRKDVRTWTAWGDSALKRHLGRLEDLEYLAVHRGGRGQSFVYELVWTAGADPSKPRFVGLIPVYDLKKFGANREKSAPGHGHVTGVSPRFRASTPCETSGRAQTGPGKRKRLLVVMKQKSNRNRSRTRTSPPETALSQLLDKHLEDSRVKNYSEYTIRSRRVHIGFFLRWCADRGITEPMEVTRPVLEAYQRHVFHYRKKNGEPLAFTGQQDRLVPLRVWFKWMARHHHILHNPASELEMPRLGFRLPKAVLTATEAEQIIALPDTRDPLGLRDRAILETLYATGMRRLEIANLKLWDVDAERGAVTIRQGKGKKDRVIPIGDRAAEWIARYTRDARPRLVSEPDDGTLFLSNAGEPLSLDYLTEMVRGYVDAAKIGKRGACHLFRHYSVFRTITA